MTKVGKMDAEITNRANKSMKIYYTLNATFLSHRDIAIEVKMKMHNTGYMLKMYPRKESSGDKSI